MIMWLLLGISSALRDTKHDSGLLADDTKKGEYWDCSVRTVASGDTQLDEVHSTKTGMWSVTQAIWWMTSIDYESCGDCDGDERCFSKYFGYFEKYNRFAIFSRVYDNKASPPWMCAAEGWHLLSGLTDDPAEVKWVLEPKFCDPSKFPSGFREQVAERVHSLCKEKLCKFATTGTWKTSWFQKEKTFEKAIALPWPAKSSRKGKGYKDAFEECWHGPEEFPDILGTFQDFAKQYDLDTPSETFNKKACGCRTEDDCS